MTHITQALEALDTIVAEAELFAKTPETERETWSVLISEAWRQGSGTYDGCPTTEQVSRVIETVTGVKVSPPSPHTVESAPANPVTAGEKAKEYVSINDITPSAFNTFDERKCDNGLHNLLKGLARNCRNEGNRNSATAAYHQLLDAIDALPASPPEQKAKPVAWRMKDFADGWILCNYDPTEEAAPTGAFVQPLYIKE